VAAKRATTEVLNLILNIGLSVLLFCVLQHFALGRITTDGRLSGRLK
jgi:hypothetical protein